MPLTLGTEPDHLDVVLVPGADFVETLETMAPDQTSPQPWPVGTTITLAFGDTTPTLWPALVDTNLLSWNVQSDAVDTLIAAGKRTARLWYENGTVKVLLAIGEARVHG